mgnify:CR=1 FL=1
MSKIQIKPYTNALGAEILGVNLTEKLSNTQIASINYPHSLGLFYSAITDFLGFEINEGEYKMMGLAPYGRPVYADIIKNKFSLKMTIIRV